MFQTLFFLLLDPIRVCDYETEGVETLRIDRISVVMNSFAELIAACATKDLNLSIVKAAPALPGSGCRGFDPAKRHEYFARAYLRPGKAKRWLRSEQSAHVPLCVECATANGRCYHKMEK